MECRRCGHAAITAAMLVATLAACSSGSIPQLTAGKPWVVEKTTEGSDVIIPAGAAISAPEGKSLTMTVDGVGMPIAPGNYRGM